MKIATSVLCLSFLILISSCSDDDDPITGTISGTVIDKVSGNVIGSAYIVTTPPSESVVSDSEGLYLIEGVLPGDYTLVCEKEGYYKTHISINVQAGRTTNAIIPMLSEVDGNHTPEDLELKSPTLGSKVKYETLTFSWNCEDPDEDKLTYSLYLGKSDDKLSLIADNIKTKNYKYKGLEDSTKYYWKVIAKDTYGATAESEVWHFGTELLATSVNEGGLILYLPFDGDANDYSGNNLHGEVMGAVLGLDRNGNSNSAYIFNGTSGYINIEDSELFNQLDNLTIACWVKPDANPGKPLDTHIDIISRSSSLGGYYLGITTKHNPEFWYSTIQGGSDFVGSNATLAPDVWSHYAFVFTSMPGELSGYGKLYINGNIVATKVLAKPRGVNLDMKIGCRNDFACYYSGRVDDVYIYNKALTDLQIKELSLE
jgi:hypothetical protein